MSSYNKLGQLMTETIIAYQGCDPATLTEHCRKGDVGTWLLGRAKSAQESLYGMFAGMEDSTKDAYLANFWSDLKFELLFPNYVKAGTKEDRKWARMVNRVGVVDDALKAANLGWEWNPDNQVTWEEEEAESQREE